VCSAMRSMSSFFVTVDIVYLTGRKERSRRGTPNATRHVWEPEAPFSAKDKLCKPLYNKDFYAASTFSQNFSGTWPRPQRATAGGSE
jgi:hypothetical protein